MFADPLAAMLQDTMDDEQSILVGQSEKGRVLITVFIEAPEGTIRIISERRLHRMRGSAMKKATDKKLREPAPCVAARQGTSLQALVRQYIETLAGSRETASLVEQLEEHWRDADKHLKEHPARSYTFNREELY